MDNPALQRRFDANTTAEVGTDPESAAGIRRTIDRAVQTGAPLAEVVNKPNYYPSTTTGKARPPAWAWTPRCSRPTRRTTPPATPASIPRPAAGSALPAVHKRPLRLRQDHGACRRGPRRHPLRARDGLSRPDQDRHRSPPARAVPKTPTPLAGWEVRSAPKRLAAAALATRPPRLRRARATSVVDVGAGRRAAHLGPNPRRLRLRSAR